MSKELINILGLTPESLGQIDANTWKSSREIMQERQGNEELRNLCFYTSNFVMYSQENGDTFIYIGGRDVNPIIKNPSATLESLSSGHPEISVYVPKPDEIEAIRKSHQNGITRKVPLTSLELKKLCPERGQFLIDFLHLDTLNPSQRKVAEYYLGFEEDFYQSCSLITNAGEDKIFMVFLNDQYVEKKFDEHTEFLQVSTIPQLNRFQYHLSIGTKQYSLHCSIRGESI